MGATRSATPGALGQVIQGHGDALYDFALAVTGDTEAAAAVVAAAVPEAVAEHGPRVTRATLLGSVLVAAVPHSPPAAFMPEALLEPGAGSPDELQRVCREATRSLDARQRGVLDLALRQGLAGEELGVALGISPGQVPAATRSAVEAAEHVVGAVLLSRLGQEDCPGLAALLDELPPDAGADRLAGDVVIHEEECTVCGDRRRALVPVTSLLAAVPPTPAPPEMMGALPLPPVSDAVPGTARRGWRRPGLILGGVGGAVLLVLAGLALTRGDDQPRPAGASPGGRLEVPEGPLEIGATVAGATLELANPSSDTLEFTARTGAPWLQVTPGGARVAPGGRSILSVVLDRARAPEGNTASEIRLRSTGGSTVIPVHTRVERPPVLSGMSVTPEAAVKVGCPGAGPLVGRATIVEESGIDRVELRQRGRRGAETVSAMALNGDSWTAALGPFPVAGEVEWWVTAFDIRGNSATSPPDVITVTGC